MTENTSELQLILGSDKRNPCFCLYTDEAEKSLHVYYGLELLEVVPNDRNSPAYRLLAARLYNAGVRVGTLERVFELDRKTMRRWGLALQSGDRQWLIAVLQGRWGRRKLTLEMESFVRHRWKMLQGEGCRDYRRVLCQELARVFGVKVVGETLRPLFKQLRAESRVPAHPAPSTAPEPEPGQPSLGAPSRMEPEGCAGEGQSVGGDGRKVLARLDPGLNLLREAESPETLAEGVPAVGDWKSLLGTGDFELESAAVGTTELSRIEEELSQNALSGGSCAPEGGSKMEEPTCANSTSGSSILPTSSKILPPKPDWLEGQTVWCEHAGLWLFWESLGAVIQGVQPAQPWLGQALAEVLAGAVNVEQSKFLNTEDLELLIGSQVRGLGPQRHLLKELAQGPAAEGLLKWNGQRVGVQGVEALYLDPHTKHYTGMAEVLKGWCPTIRWADKAVHSDFIHTPAGQPIYFECTDNFEDLRTRLPGVVARARQVLGWSADKRLTLVIDRAVFGRESFERIFQEPALRLITWQKGYRAGGWVEEKVRGQMVIERPRNRAADVRSYQFRYMDQRWEVDWAWRQLIVRATPPSGRMVEVSVLTDDWERPAWSILRLIFGRWIQENDFKYLDQHFGINQITSYGCVEYQQLKGQLTDREVESGAYRALKEKGRQLQARLGQLLFGQRQAEQRAAARQERQAELEKASAAAPDEAPGSLSPEDRAKARRQELGRLKAAQKREQKSRAARQEQIQKLEQELSETGREAGQTEQSVSRLEDLIARQMVRLDTGPKRLLDAIKIIARNEFYRALQPFRLLYDNYRDDHDHFRRLSQSAGVLRWSGGQLEVHLMPRAEYSAAMRKIWTEVLESVNAAGPVWPDGSRRPLRFHLGSRRDLQVSLRSD